MTAGSGSSEGLRKVCPRRLRGEGKPNEQKAGREERDGEYSEEQFGGWRLCGAHAANAAMGSRNGE